MIARAVVQTGIRPAECRSARSPEELATHFAIRKAIFVTEQGLFERTDRDARDQGPADSPRRRVAGRDRCRDGAPLSAGGTGRLEG